MTAIISFLIVLLLSLLVVRIAGVALTVTGMPREAARFEARSAWSGTGFTTSQSEQVTRNPVRRKIVSFLIVVRNAGIVGAASTLFFSITNIQQEEGGYLKVALLIAGLFVLWLDRRGEDFIGVPSRNIKIEAGDNLILYGRANELRNIGERKQDAAGERERNQAVHSQKREDARQEEVSRRSEQDS